MATTRKKRKAAPKKKAAAKKTSSYTRCAAPKCRKKARVNGMCEAHAEEAAYPIDGVTRLSEIERLSLTKLEAEYELGFTQVKNWDLETEKVKTDYENTLRRRAAQRTQMVQEVEVKQVEHKTLIKDLGTKYKMSPEWTYDPDTGVLRDVKPDTPVTQ